MACVTKTETEGLKSSPCNKGPKSFSTDSSNQFVLVEDMEGLGYTSPNGGLYEEGHKKSR